MKTLVTQLTAIGVAAAGILAVSSIPASAQGGRPPCLSQAKVACSYLIDDPAAYSQCITDYVDTNCPPDGGQVSQRKQTPQLMLMALNRRQ